MASASTRTAADGSIQRLPESQQAQQPRRRAQQYKRARTGCERCRARRRKCDEGKPRCQRCIDADAECQYSAHIQFLGKNALVLSNNTVSSGQSSSAPHPDHGERDNVDPRLLQVPLPEQVQEEPSEKGHEHSFNEPEVVDNENSTSIPDQPISDVPQITDSFQRWDEKWPIVGQCSLTDDEVELLRHFGHFVAPWLDVFDLNRTFGLLVPQLAMSSPCIMDGVLKLSAASSGAVDVKSTESRGIGSLFFLAMTQLTGEKSTGLTALRIIANVLLTKTRIFIQEVPDKWEPCLYGGGIPFGFDKYSFEDPILKRVWNGFVALISRTEIAYCLVKETAPAMSPDFLRGTITELPSSSQSMGTTTAITSQSPLNASISCLALLADVMLLVQPPSEREETAPAQVEGLATQPTVLSNSNNWKKLLDDLFAWYTHRPLELKTLMDVEDREAAFPTVLFTSGVGIWANTIYHTAMLLLLNHRPRSISLAEWQKSTMADKGQVSPLWHARRVCGIAVKSNPELTQCWDPCMIASFSIAARRMTHPIQQSGLITCMNRVKALGWRVDDIIQNLHEEWGTDEL